jgi:hypothetical protein
MNLPILFAGDFNVNVKDIYNAELVEFMKDIFELQTSNAAGLPTVLRHLLNKGTEFTVFVTNKWS